MRQIHLHNIDSTNRYAAQLWAESGGDCDAVAITALTQSAGVGRAGRPWSSPNGGLWLTMLWPAAWELAHYTALPLAVGATVLRTLEGATGLALELKWPNDVLVRGRKLAGILCQGEAGAQSAVIVGVGVNVNFHATALGNGLRQPATTVLDELGREVDLAALREQVIADLHKALRLYEDGGFEPFVARVRGHLAWRGQTVMVSDEETPALAGVLRDIDGMGRLLLETAAGTVPVDMGDVHVSAGPA